MRIGQIDIGEVRRNDALCHFLHREQRGQQRGHVHAKLGQVGWRQEQRLNHQAADQANGRGCHAEDQEQRRAKDQVHFGHADGHMRENFEEDKDQDRGDGAAQDQRRQAVNADMLISQLGGIGSAGRGCGIGQNDLGAVDQARFNMHLFVSLHRIHPVQRHG